jgi:hypothetical protein
MVIGADVVLDERSLSIDSDTAAGFAVVGPFIGDGILGAGATRGKDGESSGEKQGGRRTRSHQMMKKE